MVAGAEFRSSGAVLAREAKRIYSADTFDNGDGEEYRARCAAGVMEATVAQGDSEIAGDGAGAAGDVENPGARSMGDLASSLQGGGRSRIRGDGIGPADIACRCREYGGVVYQHAADAGKDQRAGASEGVAKAVARRAG